MILSESERPGAAAIDDVAGAGAVAMTAGSIDGCVTWVAVAPTSTAAVAPAAISALVITAWLTGSVT